MQLSLVFPMFWGRKKKKIYKPNDQFYDHPTALDDAGTIPQLFKSMEVLADRDFDVIVVAGATHPRKPGLSKRQQRNYCANMPKKPGLICISSATRI